MQHSATEKNLSIHKIQGQNKAGFPVRETPGAEAGGIPLTDASKDASRTAHWPDALTIARQRLRRRIPYCIFCLNPILIPWCQLPKSRVV